MLLLPYSAAFAQMKRRHWHSEQESASGTMSGSLCAASRPLPTPFPSPGGGGFTGSHQLSAHEAAKPVLSPLGGHTQGPGRGLLRGSGSGAREIPSWRALFLPLTAGQQVLRRWQADPRPASRPVRYARLPGAMLGLRGASRSELGTRMPWEQGDPRWAFTQTEGAADLAQSFVGTDAGVGWGGGVRTPTGPAAFSITLSQQPRHICP